MFGKKSMKVSDVFTDESTNAGIDVNLDNEPDLNAGYYQGTDIAYEESEVTFEPNPKPKRRGIGLFGSKKRNQRDDMHDLYESVSQQKVVAQRRDVPFMSKHSINPEDGSYGNDSEDYAIQSETPEQYGASPRMVQKKSRFSSRSKRDTNSKVDSRQTQTDDEMQTVNPPTVPIRKRRSITAEAAEQIEEDRESSKKSAIEFDRLDDSLSNEFTSEAGFFAKASKQVIEDTMLSEDEAEFIMTDDGDIIEEEQQKGVMEFFGSAASGLKNEDREEVEEEDVTSHGRECTSDENGAFTEASNVGENAKTVNLGKEVSSHRTEHDEGILGDTVLERLENAVNTYNSKVRSELSSTDVNIIFDDDKHKDIVIVDPTTHKFLLPNGHVYVNGKQKAWNLVHEIRVQKYSKVELDFGISILLPAGFGLELKPVTECGTKFGLGVAEDKVLYNAQEAAEGISVTLYGCTDASYIAEYQQLFIGKVVKFV
ncbi:hypothetical protein AALB53_16395 [Lachnospiraceae bacterium 47-T17]